MQEKFDTSNIDIPKDDIECWQRYPKHRWVYDLSRLLDIQNIIWSPYKSDTCYNQVVNMNLISTNNVVCDPAHIYISNFVGQHSLVGVYITKGDIGLIRYLDKSTNTELEESIGNVELQITSFVTMHFPKFTGIVSMELIGTHIVSVMLRLHPELALTANAMSAKLLKRIYKKNDVVHIKGLTDQIHHKSLIS